MPGPNHDGCPRQRHGATPAWRRCPVKRPHGVLASGVLAGLRTPTYTLSPTSYVVPTYRRAGLFGRRRLVERPIYTETSYYWPTASYIPTTTYSPSSTIYPTSVVYPTVASYPVVATSAMICCDEATPSRSAHRFGIAPRDHVSRTPRGQVGRSRSRATPGAVVESEPTRPRWIGRAPAMSPRMRPLRNGIRPRRPPRLPRRRGTRHRPRRPRLAQASRRYETPEPGPAPADSGLLELPPDPVPPRRRDGAPRVAEARRPLRPPRCANILEGKVVSGEGGQPEENVRVTVSNRAGAFVDRTVTTDAYGRYAIRVPDGDWTVKVTMPSGRVYDVYQLTVSGDQITDDRGEAVASLTITR